MSTEKNISLEEAPLKWLRDHLHEQYGIYFPEEKLYSLESKIKRRFQKLGLESLLKYVKHLKGNPDEVPFFLDAVTTNKTYFFREQVHWDFVRDQILPDWESRSDLIRVWSAACSSGQEAYSVAMLLEDSPAPISYKILASDISEKIIRVGSRGIYSSRAREKVRDFDPTFEERFFNEYEGASYRVIEAIRRHVYFRQFNLKFHSNPFRKAFDLIMLRNVLIYFDTEMIQNLIHHCENLLKKGGFLFIGHTETLMDVSHSLKKIQPSIYRKEEN